MTSIVPFMFGWIPQWNGYEPATLNWSVVVAPPANGSLWHWPPSSTIECDALSPFVQVTLWPAGTLTVAGVNAKSLASAWT